MKTDWWRWRKLFSIDAVPSQRPQDIATSKLAACQHVWSARLCMYQHLWAWASVLRRAFRKMSAGSWVAPCWSLDDVSVALATNSGGFWRWKRQS